MTKPTSKRISWKLQLTDADFRLFTKGYYRTCKAVSDLPSMRIFLACLLYYVRSLSDQELSRIHQYEADRFEAGPNVLHLSMSGACAAGLGEEAKRLTAAVGRKVAARNLILIVMRDYLCQADPDIAQAYEWALAFEA